MKKTTQEAFVKVLQPHGIEHAFGIIGSAMTPASDLFPKAGIAFCDCAHETNAGLMADGYTRSTGKMSMAIAQNGPGEPFRRDAMKTPVVVAGIDPADMRPQAGAGCRARACRSGPECLT